MIKNVVSYPGKSFAAFDFIGNRDVQVAQDFAEIFGAAKQYKGDISLEELKNPSADEDRFVFLRFSIELTNPEAVNAKLFPGQLASTTKIILPEQAYNDKLLLPFVGSILPPNYYETASKFSMHTLSPGTQTKPIQPKFSQIQKYSKELKQLTLPGWSVIDIPGADYAASDLLSTGENVIIKYSKSTAGQYQWTFSDEKSYKTAMRDAVELITKKKENWQDFGLVFERKIGIHDQITVGQFYFMGELISWLGRIDHFFIKNAHGEIDPIYGGSSKIIVRGPLSNLKLLPWSKEIIEDISKAEKHMEILNNQIPGGAITRINYNILRGFVETGDPSKQQTKTISGITEITISSGDILLFMIWTMPS